MKTTQKSPSRKRKYAALSIPQLREQIKGRVIAPGDEGYDKARAVFYGGIDRHPAVIVRVADAQDAARVVTLARETGLELAVRSGGHSSAGHCVSEGGIVLDLGDMRALKIDGQNLTASAETGLTAGEVTSALAEHGLVLGFGDTGTVGIGGITLGGGVGYLVRKFGLTADSLLGAEVVTADGEILQVDASSHPDLFWAIRGGGGNFGVATRFQYRLHKLENVLGGMLILPATPEVIAGFIRESEAAPDELSGILNVMAAPPMPFLPPEVHGKMVAMAILVYAGDPAEGEKVMARLRALATPLADMIKPMRYAEIYPPNEGAEDYHPIAAARTMFMDSIDVAEAAHILDELETSDASMAVAQLRVLGGAMARVPVDATAFAHRQSRIMVNLAALYQDPAKKDGYEAWVGKLETSLRQKDSGSYVNFLGAVSEAQVRAAYPGSTWDRLRQVKARYDPDNLFHMNQNIPPG